MAFKDRLKYLIENVSINNQQVTPYRIGKDTTVSRVSIENYLSGKQTPSIEKATIIAQYFNISVNWLLTGEGEIMRVEQQAIKKDEETVTVPKETWEIMKKQSDSLARRDQQIDELIALFKKDNAHRDKNVDCVAATGSDK